MGTAKKEARALKLAKKLAKLEQVVPYSLKERERKISTIMFQLGEIKMDHVITPEISKGLFNYIYTGENYTCTLPLPQYSRILEINFDNNKNNDKNNGILLRFNKITVEDNSKDSTDNPINKLVTLQEGMI